VGDLRPFHPNTPQRLRSLAPPKDRKVLAIFVLSITDRCNIACDFCCHPYMDSEIASDDAERLVHEAVREDFDEIGITGVEPFLKRKLLIKLATIARDAGKLFGVISNGYWAGTRQKADRLLGEFVEAGLTRLTISWDPSHGAFVPARVVQNALDAALNLGIKVVFVGSFKNPQESHQDFGFDLTELKKYRNFTHSVGRVAPAGNAQSLNDLNRTDRIDFQTDRCLYPSRDVHELVVYAQDGLTQPCCSVYAGYKMAAMGLGDWRSMPVRDLRIRQLGDPFFTVACEGGFKRIYEIIAEKDDQLAALLPDPKTCLSTCHLCARLMGSPIAMRIRAVLEDYLLEKVLSLQSPPQGHEAREVEQLRA